MLALNWMAAGMCAFAAFKTESPGMGLLCGAMVGLNVWIGLGGLQ